MVKDNCSGRRLRRFCLTALAASALAFASGAWAVNHVVTTAVDDGMDANSLRVVLDNAISGDTITFSSVSSITLDGALGALNVTGKTITITGPVTIHGDAATPVQIFSVGTGGSLTLDSLTLADGSKNAGTATDGGAIRNAGSLTVNNVAFTNNGQVGATANGGAIYNAMGATASIVASTFSGNGTTGTVQGTNFYNVGTLNASCNSDATAFTGTALVGNAAVVTACLTPTIVGTATSIATGSSGAAADVKLTLGNAVPANYLQGKTLTLTIDHGSFAAASATTTCSAGSVPCTAAVSSNVLTVTLGAHGALASGNTIVINGLMLDETAQATAAAVQATLSFDSSNPQFVAAASSLTIANVVGGSASITSTGNPTLTINAGGKTLSSKVSISEPVAGVIPVGNMTVELFNGKIIGATTTWVVSAGAGVATCTRNSDVKATCAVSAQASARSFTLEIPAGALDVSSSTAGALQAKVTLPSSTAVLVTLATLQTATATSVTVERDSSITAVPLYVARNTVAVSDRLKVTEQGIGALTSGTLTVALQNGKFASTSALASSDSSVVCAATTVGATQGQCAVSASATARVVYLSFPSVDLTGSTVGNFSVKVRLPGETSDRDVTLTTTKNATDLTANPSGMVDLAVGGSAVTLPDVIIKETAAAALKTGTMALLLSDGLVFDSDTVPTITVTYDNGTVVSSNPVAAVSSANFQTQAGTWGGKRVFKLTLNTASSSSLYRITISGLKVNTAVNNGQSLVSGTYGFRLIGSDSSATSALVAADLAYPGNAGAKPAPTTLSIIRITGGGGYAWSVVNGAITQQTVKGYFSPPTGLSGSTGSVFVFGYVPGNVAFAPNTIWMFDASRNWHMFTGCDSAVAYYTGPFQMLNAIPVVGVPADLSVLRDAELYIGYGATIFGPAAACNNMVAQDAYVSIYKVQ